MTITPERSRRRVLRRSLVAITAAALGLSPLVFTEAASAATPTFPDNIVVFPDRDFVSVEGYEGYAGLNATVKVTRGTQVMGSAIVPVSGTDVAFEVNHPGGFCWGTGTNLKVTPDIRPGDVVSVTFPDGRVEETRTSSATVTEDMTLSGTTLTIRGSYGPDVNTAFFEQRVINPDLVDLIGKRDIRALPGPVVPAATGGYSSGLTFNNGTFLATYEFADQAAADTAAAADLGERAMNWQVEDGAGNRQGLTIAEFGEAGGPGMGGCPLGPGDQAAPAGSYTAVRSADGSSVQVKWNAVAAQPGAAPVTGYQVDAITSPPAADGTSAVVGTRTDTTKSQVNLALDPALSYRYEVRSLADTRMSVPFTLAGGAGSGDTTLPTLTVTPTLNGGGDAVPTPADQVTVTTNGQAFFTTDGSPVVNGNMPSDSARFVTGPISITGPTTLKVVAFDAANNINGPFEGSFVPGAPPAAPAAPTGLAGISTQDSVALTWNAGDASVTGYQVRVYDAGGVALPSQPPVTSIARQTVDGLQPDTVYLFEVRAINAGGTSAPSTPQLSVRTKVPTDQITIASARYRAGKDFRIVGTGSVVGNTIEIHRVNASGNVGNLIAGAVGQVVAAAPPGIGDWDIRLRNGAVPNNRPAQIYAVSSGGGVAGPFTVQ